MESGASIPDWSGKKAVLLIPDWWEMENETSNKKKESNPPY